MLSLDNIVYNIRDRVILDNVKLQLPDGHKAGLVGRNGCGKSTLFKIILNELEADSGEINVSKGLVISTVPQEVPGSKYTPLEYLLNSDSERKELFKELETCTDPDRLGEICDRLNVIDAYSAEARAAIILKGLGFSEEEQQRSLSEFSGGFRMRVALASALFKKPDLLLLDEPTNHLDLKSILWLQDFISNYPGSVLVISHDRDFLNEVAKHIFHLQQGKITAYTGNYDTYEATYQQKLESDMAYNKKIEAQKAHMQKFIDRFKSKASKAKQAQSRIKALAKLNPISLITDDPSIKFTLPEVENLPSPIISFDKVKLGYDNKIVLFNLKGSIANNDRIALLGENGNGKSTFAKLLANTLKPMSGHYESLDKLRIGYFNQHQFESLNLKETPIYHIKEILPNISETQVRTHLGGFGFPKDKASMEVGQLSGGEKARLVFAIITATRPHILILDEPTNHLDIEMRESLIMAINSFEGAVVLITHDLYLLKYTVDSLWIVENQTVQPYHNTIDDYKKKLYQS